MWNCNFNVAETDASDVRRHSAASSLVPQWAQRFRNKYTHNKTKKKERKFSGAVTRLNRLEIALDGSFAFRDALGQKRVPYRSRSCEANYNEAYNAGQEKALSAPTLNSEPCKAIIKPHHTPVHQHEVTFLCLSAFIMALLYVETLSALARRSDLTPIGHIIQLLNSILPELQLCVIVLCCNSLIICSLKMREWDKSLGNTHQDHQQMRLPIDLTFGKATSILANNTDREKIDEDHWKTRLSLASYNTSVHTLDQRGRQNVKLVAQNPVVFPLHISAEYRSLKVSKLGRAVFACWALGNFVTLAQPSGPVYWKTFVSGTFSTLCSYVELQLPTGLEGGGGHNDLSIVIMSKR